MKFIAALALVVILGCAENLTLEERSDVAAEVSLDAIHVLQTNAKTLFTLETIGSDQYREILKATHQLTLLMVDIEAAADLGSLPTQCVTVTLNNTPTEVCDRQGVYLMLLQLRDML